MKINIFIVVLGINLFAFSFAKCAAVISLKNSSDTTNGKSISDMKVRLISIESKYTDLVEHQKENLEIIMANLKNATFLVEGMALLLTLFLAWLGVYTFMKFKRAKNEIETINAEVQLKMKKLEKIFNKITVLEETIIGEQTYARTGIDNLFNILNDFFGSKKDIIFRDKVLIKHQMCNLHSLEANDRFNGITGLMQQGKFSDIEHLERIVLKNGETDNNKKLAMKAIEAIRIRTNLPPQPPQ